MHMRCPICKEIFETNFRWSIICMDCQNTLNTLNAKLNARLTSTGIKHDDTKPRWSLLPNGTVATVVAVLEFGAKKYSVDNWQTIPDAERRYYDAAMRHIDAWRFKKDLNDPDSGLPHLAHAVCCLLFLMWFDGDNDA